MIKFRWLHCSFCGKKETEVSKLVAGPHVFICDECVSIAARMMQDSHDDTEPPKVELPLGHKLWARCRQLLGGGQAIPG